MSCHSEEVKREKDREIDRGLLDITHDANLSRGTSEKDLSSRTMLDAVDASPTLTTIKSTSETAV